MSNTYEIKRLWMEHSGGTKFYQIFGIVATRDAGMAGRISREATAFHFAGFRGDMTKFRLPKNGGQVQIVAGDQLSAKTREKEKHTVAKGHYSIVETRVDRFDSADAFGRQLRTAFGSSDAENILSVLSMDTHIGMGTPSEDAPDPISPGEDTPVETPTTPRPEAWGSW
jgi:hypothetical protein